MTKRAVDDPAVLRRSIAIAPLLEGIEEVELGSGPAWELGRVGITKGWPQYETHDLPGDLMAGAAFRKVSFAFPDENLRGVAAFLTYGRDGDEEPEVIAGFVPVEREAQLDGWITFLNDQIRAGHAAKDGRRGQGH
jgi:hypothetical protein